MPFAASLSTAVDTEKASAEVCQAVQPQFPGEADLALVFFSPHHAGKAEVVVQAIRERLRPRALLGCVGESIVGNDQEIEHRPAISLWLGGWGGRVELEPFHLTLEETADGMSLLGWPDSLLAADSARAAVILLGDPYTFPADEFLKQMNQDHRGLKVMGGMASGTRGPGECRLVQHDNVLNQGAVGVLLQGPPPRTIVSQGCRPIGRHFLITACEENIITGLGGKPPLAQLQQLWNELSPRDQQLFQQGLHLGVVINEYQAQFERGDFLVRNVLGLDRESGAMAITDRTRVGQTVQFHVRDADTADEDLKTLIGMDRQVNPRPAAGALLFTCNGRGSRLFSAPHHDAAAVRAAAPVPLAGFFAQGELGPVGGQNFIHGFTASVVLFE